LVVGDEIIETPTCWRSRYFEGDAHRKLFKEYFAGGARWIAPPRPQLPDELYDASYRVPEPEEPIHYITNEFEPVFDAADGRALRSRSVRHLQQPTGPGFAGCTVTSATEGLHLHQLESRCARPMHIDTTVVPLAPRKVLINPDFIDVDRLPSILKRWDVLIAPRPDPVDDLMAKFSMCSPWTSINVLMLDHRRVVAEASQPTLHRALKIGVRARPVTVSCLRPLWRGLPLRHIGH
jgi:glycine amidinotransferase